MHRQSRCPQHIGEPSQPKGHLVVINVVAHKEVEQVAAADGEAQFPADRNDVTPQAVDKGNQLIEEIAHGNDVGEDAFTPLLGDEAEHRNGQIGPKQGHKEPIHSPVSGVEDGVHHGVHRHFFKGIALQNQLKSQGHQAPHQKGNDCLFHPFDGIGSGVVVVPVVQQGGPGDHEEHRHRKVEHGFQRIGGEPHPFIGKAPEHPVGMENHHGHTGDHRHKCEKE